jgi:ABC-type bacteriocin/lantibiotic exporter with double-glycine peptidase domain
MINILNKVKYATAKLSTALFNIKGAGSLARDVIAVIIALFVFAILAPIALNQIYATTTSDWNPAVATLFTVFVPVMAVLAVAIGFVVLFLRKR